jgi:transcription elongation factor GreA
MDAARRRGHDGVVATAQTSITHGNDPIIGGADADALERTTDLLSALERSEVGAARIAQVAALIELASALDDGLTLNGGAGVGSIVTVSDRAGRTSEYELIERPDPEGARQKVTLGSPVGKALLGARPGDYVRVALPNGRQRRVHVIDVAPKPFGPSHAALEGSAAAA